MKKNTNQEDKNFKEMRYQTRAMYIEIIIIGVFGFLLTLFQINHQLIKEEPDLRFGDAYYGNEGTSIIIPLENTATSSFDASIKSINVSIKNNDDGTEISAQGNYILPNGNVTISDGTFSGRLNFLFFDNIINKEPSYIEVYYQMPNDLNTTKYKTSKFITTKPLDPLKSYTMNIELTYHEIGTGKFHTIATFVDFGFKNGIPTTPVTGIQKKY